MQGVNLKEMEEKISEALATSSEELSDEQRVILQLAGHIDYTTSQMILAARAIMCGMCPDSCKPCGDEFKKLGQQYLKQNPWMQNIMEQILAQEEMEKPPGTTVH